jgi:hypothetical protein
VSAASMIPCSSVGRLVVFDGDLVLAAVGPCLRLVVRAVVAQHLLGGQRALRQQHLPDRGQEDPELGAGSIVKTARGQAAISAIWLSRMCKRPGSARFLPSIPTRSQIEH